MLRQFRAGEDSEASCHNILKSENDCVYPCLAGCTIACLLGYIIGLNSICEQTYS